MTDPSRVNLLIPPEYLDHSTRGDLPRSLIFGSKRPDGRPDDDASKQRVADAALTAYLLGFDTFVRPRVVDGKVVPGDWVLTVTAARPRIVEAAPPGGYPAIIHPGS